MTPSYLKEGRPTTNSAEDLSNEPFLRMGRIIRINYPTSRTALTCVTYDVQVDWNSDGGVTTLTYYNCRVNDPFGGVADYFRYTLRPVANKNEYNPFDVGSTVLVAALGGNMREPIIMGGVPHPESAIQEDEGHNLKFSFNGVKANITKYGALTLELLGETTGEGEVTVPINTKLEFKESGDVSLINKGTTSIDSAQGIKLGAARAVQPIVLGTTWRSNESLLHANLVAQLSVLGAQLAVVAAQLGLAGAANAVSGTLALPFFTAATVALTSMDASITTIVGAIQAYEAAANNQLSKKNFTE